MLRQIGKENDEEMVKVDMWCHFGHAYITKVDEGEMLFHLFAFENNKKLVSLRFFWNKLGLWLLIRSVAINSPTLQMRIDCVLSELVRTADVLYSLCSKFCRSQI